MMKESGEQCFTENMGNVVSSLRIFLAKEHPIGQVHKHKYVIQFTFVNCHISCNRYDHMICILPVYTRL